MKGRLALLVRLWIAIRYVAVQWMGVPLLRVPLWSYKENDSAWQSPGLIIA